MRTDYEVIPEELSEEQFQKFLLFSKIFKFIEDLTLYDNIFSSNGIL